MAGYQRCISLAVVCLLLCHDSLAYESTACNSEGTQSVHDNFLKNHVPDGAPQNDFPAHWQSFLGEPDPARPTQSFLRHRDLDRVLAVCSDKEGRQYTGAQPERTTPMTSLCISQKRFTFYTVRSNQVNKENPYSVKKEFKHVILACDKVGAGCLPTHFEGQGRNDKQPDTSAKGCQGGTIEPNPNRRVRPRKGKKNAASASFIVPF